MTTIIVTLAVLLLYCPLFPVTEAYSLTVGGVAALIVVVAGIMALRPPYRGMRFLVVALGLPLLIYGAHMLIGTPYAIDFGDFVESYGLWTISSVIIWLAFQNVTLWSAWDVRPALIVMTATGMLQFLGARLFGTFWGFSLVQPLIGFDIFNSYLPLRIAQNARAIGTYYEPSMLARVSVTLATMLLVRTNRLWLPMLFIAANFVTTLSVGLVVLAVGTLAFYYGRFSRRTIQGLIALAILLVPLQGFLSERLVGDRSESAYRRVVAPLLVLPTIMAQYPIGVPFGSNELVVERTLGTSGFDEQKITNGVFELLLYMGVFGIGTVIWLLALLVRHTVAGQRRFALVLLFLLLSTAASSSFFSIESSLLLYLFIVHLRFRASPKVDG